MSDKAHKEIDKYIDIGSFIFSDAFYSKLKEYQKESDEVLSDTHGWIDFLINDNQITEKYLENLITLAKDDLNH